MTFNLEEARQFHGHLGPWLVVGLRMGEAALERLQARKYFGVHVRVECPPRPPQSCLVDGLQLSTGATCGKSNLELIAASQVRVVVRNKDTDETVEFRLVAGLPERLAAWLKAEGDEAAARQVAQIPPSELFVMDFSAKS
ncbi:MAG TPA: hypothetical protein EYP85_15210 [Armatimonadetes bacterium]|nr:hypothetical protein [Armatimonadota bacterium]